MKVYELMNILSKMPSGATVNIASTICETTLKKMCPIDENEEEGKVYSYLRDVNDVDLDPSEEEIYINAVSYEQ